MNPDLLLILPPYTLPHHHPIGIATLASHYRNKGFKVEVLDAIALGYNHQQVVKCIMKRDPAIIGISIPYTEMAVTGKKMLDICSMVFHDKRIWVGGHHTEICPDEFIEDNEYTLMGKVEISPDTIPAWDLMPEYDTTLHLSTGERAFPIQSSFGCPFKCAFCCNSKNPRPIRYKGIDCVIEEMKWVIKDFGVHGFHFWDETFTTNKKRTIELCERIIAEKLDVRWSAQTRIGMLDADMAHYMGRAGCVRVSFGIESGNDHVLESINKQIPLGRAHDSVKAAKGAGIITYSGFMIGHAEDTIESVCQTIEFARLLGTDHAGFRIAIPYPGTVFRNMAILDYGLLSHDWADYKDNAVVYMPPRLEGYDLLKIQQLARDYFKGEVDGEIRVLLKAHCKS